MNPVIKAITFVSDSQWISLIYASAGCCFVGRWRNEQQEHYEWDFEQEETIKAIPEELAEYAGLQVWAYCCDHACAA